MSYLIFFLIDLKGPVLAWINCIEAMKELGQDIPINLKVGREKQSTVIYSNFILSYPSLSY